jgi:hypothetical protein
MNSPLSTWTLDCEIVLSRVINAARELVFSAAMSGRGSLMPCSKSCMEAMEAVAAAHTVIAIQAAGEGRGDHPWVKPKLVGEVKFTEWTSGGEMRHPAFLGLREDKKPKDVVLEKEERRSK